MAISLAPLLMLVAVISFIVSLIDPRTRPWALGSLAVAGLVAAGIWMLFMWIKYARDIPPTTIVSEHSRQFSFAQTSHLPPQIANSTTDQTVSAPTKSAANEPSKFNEHPLSASRPDWLDQPPSKQGDAYVVAVESGVYSDPTVREQMLDAKMVAAANRYIDEVLYRQGGVADAVALDADFVRNFVHDHVVSSSNDETSIRLEFNQRFRDEVEHRYKQYISLGRMSQLGIVALAGVSLLGGLYTYLRSTQPRNPPATKPAQVPA